MPYFIISLIAGAFAITLSILFIKIYNESQDKKRRKECLHFAEMQLHKMALQFQEDCMEATKKVISQYSMVLTFKRYRYGPDYMTYSFLSEYEKSIDSIKEDYLVHYAIRYSNGDNLLRCEAEDLPVYILVEYKAEISKIATTFHKLSDSMRKHIEEEKEKLTN